MQLGPAGNARHALCPCVQGLAPLVDIPELERSILGRGGNINYKHFFVKPGQADGEHCVG